MPDVATPIEVRQLALAKEVTRGTCPAAPDYFLSVTKDSEIDFTTKLLASPSLYGANATAKSFPGAQGAKGTIKTPARAQNIGEFLNMLFGAAASSTEQATFTVTTGSNDKINFKEGGGAERTGTIAPGTYLMGTTSATVGTLCKAVKTALEGASGAALTYTVTYSMTTKKMTITASSSTVQILWLTGTNQAISARTLLGWTAADTSAALAVTSDSTTTTPAWKHTFTQGQVIQLPSYAFYLGRGLSKKQYNLGSMSKLKFSGKDDSPVEMEAEIWAQLEAAYGGSWSPSYTESAALMFSQTTVKVAGAASTTPNVAAWGVELDPGMKEYRPLSLQQYPQDFLAAGPFGASGEMVVYFMSETERDKFIALTTTTLEFLIEGGVVGGASVKYTLDLYFPEVEYEAFPFGDEGGFLGAKVKWRARFSTSSNFLAQAYVINARTSY